MKMEIIMIIERVILTVMFCTLLGMIAYDIYDSFIESQAFEWLTFEECMSYKGIGIKIVLGAIVLVMHELVNWGTTLDDDKDEVTV